MPKVHDLEKSVAGDGCEVLPVSVLELCKPEHAARVLGDDDARIVTSMMAAAWQSTRPVTVRWSSRG